MHLGIKFIILERFSTQADFAIAIGAHESKVSQVIHGRRKLTTDDMVTWSKALGCKKSLLCPLIRSGSGNVLREN